MAKTRIGDFLTRRREGVRIEDEVEYRQVTVGLYHRGVRLRGVQRGAEIKTKQQYAAHAGDFILSRIDARNAAFGIVPAELDGAVVTNDFPTYRIDEGRVLVEYFHLFTMTDEFLDACVRASAGTTNRQRIQEDFFLSYTVELPEVEEQAAIVQRYQRARTQLDRVMARLESQQREVDVLRQRILQDAVQGRLTRQDPADELADVLLKRIEAEKWRLAKAGEIKKPKPAAPVGEDEQPFELPAGWTWARMEQVFNVTGGIQKSPKRQPGANAYPYLSVADVQRGSINVGDLRRFELFEGELERYRLKRGDLLVVEGNGSESEIGRCAVWEGAIDDCVHQNHLIRCRPFEPNISRYALIALNSPFGTAEMKRLAVTTSGLYNLSVGKINAIAFPLPPLTEQQRIVARVDRLMALCDQLENRLAQARADAARLMQAVLEEALAPVAA
jgi:type I restriction enzyme S subunit